MQNKTILVTGGTSGIGHSTALLLAKKGYDIYIVGRSQQACKKVVGELEAINPRAKFGYYLCDLLSQKQIREMAKKIKGEHQHLDILVNNAGGVFASRELTDEGFEKTFALNHLAYFTLTEELLPLLKNAPKARIVCVSSNSHLQGKIDWDNLQCEKKYFIMSQYENTKLMNVLFVKELANKLKGTNITVNALHPGVVKTRIGNKSQNSFFGFAWQAVSSLAGISEERGAATSVYLASSDEVEGISGKYFANCKEHRINKIAEDGSIAKKLWEISEKLTGG
jgi:NAD(P)-dependent dehydrogenase (short-subunit alcohol dehydrogenase family)